MPDWSLFLLSSLIWGTTWFIIKFQLGVVAPAVSIAYRFGAAALLLFAWCAARRGQLRFDLRTHASFAVLGVLQFSLNYLLIYWSEEHLASGLVAVVFGLVVLWNILGSRLFFGSPTPLAVVAGAAVGMSGVVLVFWPELSRLTIGEGGAVGVGFAVAASLVASAGNLWSQRIYAKGVGVLESTAWSMGYGAALDTVYCVARGLPFRFDPSLRYVASLAYLSVFGSVVAFVAYLTLLRRVGATRASYTVVATPALAMVTSTLFEGYRWSPLALFGMLFVLAGNLMVLRAKQAAARKREPAARIAEAPSGRA